MKCKKCGASLLDTDKFCDQCGWKVVRERRCPECGAPLREGTKFCPKCGVLIGSRSSDEGKVFVRGSETSDIPIADIEQNILSETERELHTAKKPRPVSKPKKSVPAPEPKKKEKPAPVKKKVYEDWDDEDEEDDEYTGPNLMVIATVIMALLIVLVAAVLFVKMRRPVKSYEKGVEEEQVQDEEESEDGENNGETEPEEDGETDNAESNATQPIGTLSIVSNVNVRDNPSKEGTNIIKVAKEGETYEYLGTVEDGDWYVILLEDGSTAYVFEEYVSIE